MPASTDPEFVKVAFPVDGLDTIRTEGLWCRPLGEYRYEVANIPALVYDLAVGDIVKAVESSDPERLGELDFEMLVTPSNHSTIRIALLPDATAEDRTQFGVWIEAMKSEWGFQMEHGGSALGIYALDLDEGETAAALWDALPHHLLRDCGVIRDGSPTSSATNPNSLEHRRRQRQPSAPDSSD